MIELGKQKLKRIKSLTLKKYRQKYNKFILEGQKTLLDIPDIHQHRVEKIYYTKDQFSSALQKKFGDKYQEVEERVMKQMSNMSTSPGCLAIADSTDLIQNEHKITGPCLYLEDINIPGNLGTIIRTADWFGYERIFVSPNTVDLFNPKVLQACMGSFWNIIFSVVPLEDLVRTNGEKIYGTVMNGDDYRSMEWPESFLLVMGNESNGLSESAIELCTDFVGIPGREEAVADSLNVAVSAAIIMSSNKKGKM